MTPEEFAARMRTIEAERGGDPEAAHGAADELLLGALRALGYGEGCDVFERLDRWYA